MSSKYRRTTHARSWVVSAASASAMSVCEATQASWPGTLSGWATSARRMRVNRRCLVLLMASLTMAFRMYASAKSRSVLDRPRTKVRTMAS
jgi:hypothetical protein